MSLKKLMDILFESEDEVEIKLDEPLEAVSVEEAKLKEKKLEEEALKRQEAKKEEIKVEVKKSEPLKTKTENKERKTNTTLIDYDKPKHSKKVNSEVSVKEESEIYKSQPAISPIFGYVDGEKDYTLKTPQIKMETDSRLGTVYSPYYGMLQQKDLKKKHHSDVLPEEKTDDEPISLSEGKAGVLPIKGIESVFDDEEFSQIAEDFEIEKTEEMSLFDELFLNDKD